MCVIITGRRAFKFVCSVETTTDFVFHGGGEAAKLSEGKIKQEGETPRGMGRDFSLPQNLEPCSGVRPDVCSMGTGVSFP